MWKNGHQNSNSINIKKLQCHNYRMHHMLKFKSTILSIHIENQNDSNVFGMVLQYIKYVKWVIICHYIIIIWLQNQVKIF